MTGRTTEFVYALLVEANPYPDLDDLPLPRVAHLRIVRSDTEGISPDRPISLPSRPPRHRFRWVPALAGAAVVAVAIGVAALVNGGGNTTAPASPTETTTGIPGLSPDLVGQALTLARNAGDPEVFLGLFSDDAELRFFTGTFTPGEIRAGAAMSGTASNFQYDRAWARIMNQQETYSSCVINGDRVLCDLMITSDYLAPIMPPDPHTVAIQVRDGQIVLFVVAGVEDPSNEIRADYHKWTFENYPEEAVRMWESDWQPDELPTEESARLHLRLGEEYVRSRQ